MAKELRVVFLTPGGLGSGEIVNAVLVAEQLRKKGVDCSFLTFPYGALFIRPHKFECVVFGDDKLTNITTMKKYIDRTHPDAIVIADYHLFQTGKILPQFLWIGWMEELGIPVLSFDNLYLGREFPKFEYFKNPAFYPKQKYNINFKVPPFVRTLIYPSPPFDRSPDERDFCGRLYEETFTDYERDPSMKEKLGIDLDEKLIFHIIPRWASKTVEESPLLNLPEYYSMLAALLTHHFERLNEKIHLVCVNPSTTTLYMQKDKMRVDQVKFLPFNTYMKYLMTADMVVTDNILSATTWKAVLHRVPTLVLGNSLMTEDAASKCDVIAETYPVSSEYMELIRTHLKGSSSPHLPILSFWTFYTALFADMDIGKTFLIQELFDERGTFEMLKKILTDEKFKKELRKKQDEYIKKIAELPTMADIILSIAQDGSFQKK